MLFTCGSSVCQVKNGGMGLHVFHKEKIMIDKDKKKINDRASMSLFPTISSKKNQACCRAPSLTLPLLTTHWRASSSWKSYVGQGCRGNTVDDRKGQNEEKKILTERSSAKCQTSTFSLGELITWLFRTVYSFQVTSLEMLGNMARSKDAQYIIVIVIMVHAICVSQRRAINSDGIIWLYQNLTNQIQ